MSFLALVAGMVVTWSISLPSPALAQTAVSLSRFTATGRVNNILIEWETATEFNNAGFFVWASDAEDGIYDPISDFFEAQGDGVTGVIYGFVDEDVEPAVPKYYKLEAIDLNQSSEFFGPVSAAANQGLASVTPTSMLAATATSTVTQAAGVQQATQTPTAKQSNLIPTASQTPAISSTQPSNDSAYPAQAASTQNAFPAFNGLGTPYPSVNGQTPLPANPDTETTQTSGAIMPGKVEPAAPASATEPTLQISLTPNQTSVATGSPQAIAIAQGQDGVQLPPFTALVVVLVIWAMLAGWFYISVQRLE